MKKEEEDLFFIGVNNVCKSCIKECKQCKNTVIEQCPKYENKKGEKGYHLE